MNPDPLKYFKPYRSNFIIVFLGIYTNICLFYGQYGYVCASLFGLISLPYALHVLHRIQRKLNLVITNTELFHHTYLINLLYEKDLPDSPNSICTVLEALNTFSRPPQESEYLQPLLALRKTRQALILQFLRTTPFTAELERWILANGLTFTQLTNTETEST